MPRSPSFFYRGRTRIYWDNGKENGNYKEYGDLYRGYIGYIIGYILGLYWDNGKENGNYKEYGDLYRAYIGYIIGYIR